MEFSLVGKSENENVNQYTWKTVLGSDHFMQSNEDLGIW